MLETLKELCLINGVSGDETDVRQYIINKIKDINVEYKIDNLGNLIVFKKGKLTPKNKVMITAHMDEVGFIISYITKEGFIKVKPVGGILPSAVLGRRIKFKSGILGVAGAKPIHKLTAAEKENQPKIEDIHIDIGAGSRKEAEKYLSIADNGYFIGEFSDFGSGLIRGKAIDDRVGCAAMIKMISNELMYDAYFVFTTEEEVGARGAAVATYNVQPDISIVLEATTACDISGVSGGDIICSLGDGVAISFMDNGAIYDKELYDVAFFTAHENNLKCQTKTRVLGGNDSSSIHKSIGGVRTLALSVPCRYLHTAACAANKNDCLDLAELAERVFEKVAIL